MNERLRKKYAPDSPSLFSDHGLDQDISDQPRYSDEELAEIGHIMREMIARDL